MKNVNVRIYILIMFFVFITVLLLFTNVKSSVMKILHIKTDEAIIAEQQTTIHNLATVNQNITNDLQKSIQTNQKNIKLLKNIYDKKTKIEQVTKLDINNTISKIEQVKKEQPIKNVKSTKQPKSDISKTKKKTQPVKLKHTTKSQDAYIIDKNKNYVLGEIIYNKIFTTYKNLTEKDKQ